MLTQFSKVMLVSSVAMAFAAGSAQAQSQAEFRAKYYEISKMEVQSVDEVLDGSGHWVQGDFWGNDPGTPGTNDPANPNPGNGGGIFDPFPGGSNGGPFDPFPGGSSGGPFDPFPNPFPDPNYGGGSKGLVIADQIVNLGKKIWDLVKTGKPVVNVQVDAASGVPQGISDWRELVGWQMPRSRLTRMNYRNGFNAEVVSFTYRIVYTYGAGYEGRGKYLSQVSVVPANIQVAWGYSFDAKTSVPNVINVGTKEDPEAGMEVLVQWKVETVFKHEQNTHSYFIRGDGSLTDLTEGRQ